MANFKDFLAGFTASIGRQRQEQALAKREDEQWEKRQRILADLDVDKRRRLNALEKKDGNTYQKGGEWVTEVLDGGGNVTGLRPATPAEIASVESATLGVDKTRFEVETMDDKERRAEEAHNVDIRYKNRSLDLQERRLKAEEEAMRLAQLEAGGSAEAEVDKFLDSPRGQQAAKAYAGTITRVVGSNPNLGGLAARAVNSGSEAEVEYAARQRLRESIMQHLDSLPADQRPKNNVELQALITRLAGTAGTSLDRYATPIE